MSEPASISSGIAERYAAAVFEIAKEDNSLDTLEADLDELSAVFEQSDDLRDLVFSPIYSREAQRAGITAVAEKMGLSDTLKKTLGLMAEKRRLFVIPAMVHQLRDRIATEKGIVFADVISAVELSDDQRQKLSETLKAQVGKDVKIKSTVDESLIGGLVVKVGSKMIDTSIRSKLNSLRNAMKEVG